jgi:hypothetical protein
MNENISSRVTDAVASGDSFAVVGTLNPWETRP